MLILYVFATKSRVCEGKSNLSNQMVSFCDLCKKMQFLNSFFWLIEAFHPKNEGYCDLEEKKIIFGN